MAHDADAGRDVFQHFGAVFADPVPVAATLGTDQSPLLVSPLSISNLCWVRKGQEVTSKAFYTNDIYLFK